MAAIDTDGGHDEGPSNGAFDSSLPLKGVTICCTSIPDEKRVHMASIAAEMGAVHRYDLTGDVTHLIVGNYDTPKYRFVAKNRPDVRPMTVNWVEALRELWIAAQEIDFEALEREYTLPTLHSLRFSMTGCDDSVERQSIAEKIKANGAEYEGDLTKRITHLISFRTEGAKYKAARTWGLHIVSLEWLDDSLERGMILDEKLYDPALPEDQRGKDAWDRSKPKRTSLGKRTRDDTTASLEEGKRKLRRTASTKLSTQNEGIWGDIVGAGTTIQVSRSMQWDRPEIESFRRSESIEKRPDPSVKPNLQSTTSVQPVSRGMFSGCGFCIFAFNPVRTRVLCNHLLPHDGVVIDNIDGLAEASRRHTLKRLHVIIPHDLPRAKYPSLPPTEKPVEFITEWWIERCLHHKKFLDPQDHVIGRPFGEFPITAFQDMIISTSAFSGIDLRHVKEAAQLLGATYSEDFTPKSSVLVTKSQEGLRKDKLDHAQQWGVPIVTANWLWDSIEAGKCLGFKAYEVIQKSVGNRGPSHERLQQGKASLDKRTDKSDVNPISKTSGTTTTMNSRSKSPRPDHNDTTPFTSVETVIVNKDEAKPEPPLTASSSSATQENSNKSEPLSEIPTNSPKRTLPKPDNPPKIPPQDIENAITNLLARTKSASAQDISEENRRRSGKRILGRATSNVSTGSTNFSRATSVDSTATHGNAVEWNAGQSNSNILAGSGSLRFQGADGDRAQEEDEKLPPPTQIQYDDPDSKDFKEQVMARMMGEKLDPKKREKAVTIGDVAEWSKTTASRRSTRDKGGRERGGYR